MEELIGKKVIDMCKSVDVKVDLKQVEGYHRSLRTRCLKDPIKLYEKEKENVF